MKYEVVVELKGEVLDPEGRAIRETLQRLGHDSVRDVKVSKRFVIEVDTPRGFASTANPLRVSGAGEPDREVADIANGYLANPISETYRVTRID